MKKGSFTIEAAIIVPISLTMIAVLLGFCYLTHQMNWYKGAACESIVYSLQKNQNDDVVKKLLDEHMDKRNREIPLQMGDIKLKTEVGTKVMVSFEGSIIPEYFNGLMKFNHDESLMIIDPVLVKRTEFIVRGLTKG